MNPELKAKWVEALRSGQFQKGKKSLCVGQKYCCLGVLCQVAGLEFNGNDAFPNNEQLTALGLPEPMAWKLAFNNDGKAWGHERIAGYVTTESGEDIGAPFSAIADYIEANL